MSSLRVSQRMVAVGSLACTAVTVANAFLINKQFFPSIIYLTKSNASLAVVYLQALVLVYLFFQLVRRVFFGELRASEAEHLSERAWHAVMETCLAFTVFRDDFSPFFAMQFVLLLFVKCFHWLADDRVDLMERSPIITITFHIRIMMVTALLGAIDSHFISYAYFHTLNKGASSQVVFGFEYAILLTMVLQVVFKYLLHMHDLRSAQPWEAKSLYLLHAELLINLIRCVLYVLFIVVMLRVHMLPLFSIRPFYLSLRSFHKALNDVILSRRAVHAMNNRFPVVSAEELATMDTTCIICREEMTAASLPKRLPCSHVFHAHCLRSWFQRQQSCPTCRTDILSPRPAPAAAAAPAGAAAPPAPPPNLFPFMAAHQFAAFPPPPLPPRPANETPLAAPPSFPGMPTFPGLPPLPPPFSLPSPPSVSGLSDEELRALEGNTRAALEARIRVLSDIATLLDAAVLQMQQYASLVPPVLPPSAPPSGQPSSQTLPNDTTAAATSEEESGEQREPEEREAEEREGSPSGSDSPSTSQNDDLSQIRQRRLQRFID